MLPNLWVGDFRFLETDQTVNLRVNSAAATTLSIAFSWRGAVSKVLPIVFIAVLVTCCILMSPKKEIWVDECYALQVVTDRSIHHLVSALALGVDGGMPLYYLIAYAW